MDKPKEPDALEELRTIRTGKILSYPYYPVAHAVNDAQLTFLFYVEEAYDPTIVVTPFRGAQCLPHFQIPLEQLPRKSISLLRVLKMQREQTAKTIRIGFMDFVLGFNSGFLVRCMLKTDGRGRRKFEVMEKLNKDISHRETLMARMSKSLFSGDDWYPLQLEKPVRFFTQIYTIKHKYAYLVGNRLILTASLSEQAESECFQAERLVNWDVVSKGMSTQLQKDKVMAYHGANYKAVQTSSTLMIDWQTDIAAFAFDHMGQMIIADNSSNSVFIYEVSGGIFVRKVYKFDLDIRQLSYHYLGNGAQMLIVMPYDNNLYVFNLASDEIAVLKGHKSYISQATITESRAIVTGGCDHRVGLKPLRNIKKWNKIPITGQNILKVDSDSLQKQQFSQTYFLGEFSNTNSSRNNSCDYGFGNFLPLCPRTKSYAFLSYDQCIKLYNILI